jgi:hypothetical protein
MRSHEVNLMAIGASSYSYTQPYSSGTSNTRYQNTSYAGTQAATSTVEDDSVPLDPGLKKMGIPTRGRIRGTNDTEQFDPGLLTCWHCRYK